MLAWFLRFPRLLLLLPPLVVVYPLWQRGVIELLVGHNSCGSNSGRRLYFAGAGGAPSAFAAAVISAINPGLRAFTMAAVMEEQSGSAAAAYAPYHILFLSLSLSLSASASPPSPC